uniref:Uncharacterized protein n=1 Tax=Rhizophora mucronata TaxID=61149 RepID=A0A2P2QY46_RHIMU
MVGVGHASYSRSGRWAIIGCRKRRNSVTIG